MAYPFLACFARGWVWILPPSHWSFLPARLSECWRPLFRQFRTSAVENWHAGWDAHIFPGGRVGCPIPIVVTLSAALFLSLIGKYLFDPAMQAYLGDRVPYRERGWRFPLPKWAGVRFYWRGSIGGAFDRAVWLVRAIFRCCFCSACACPR